MRPPVENALVPTTRDAAMWMFAQFGVQSSAALAAAAPSSTRRNSKQYGGCCVRSSTADHPHCVPHSVPHGVPRDMLKHRRSIGRSGPTVGPDRAVLPPKMSPPVNPRPFSTEVIAEVIADETPFSMIKISRETLILYGKTFNFLHTFLTVYRPMYSTLAHIVILEYIIEIL